MSGYEEVHVGKEWSHKHPDSLNRLRFRRKMQTHEIVEVEAMIARHRGSKATLVSSDTSRHRPTAFTYLPAPYALTNKGTL
jgi:hypothetical protein